VRLAILLSMLAGLTVAVQISLTSAAQRMLGPTVLVAISGFTTGLVALAVSLVVAKPEFTGRAIGYAICSGVLGAVVFHLLRGGTGWGGASPLARHRHTTHTGLILDALGLFGAGSNLTP
jgi:bacterial/archaeal transporter family-2 protein